VGKYNMDLCTENLDVVLSLVMTRLITLDLNDYYFDPCAHTHNHFTALFPGLPG